MSKLLLLVVFLTLLTFIHALDHVQGVLPFQPINMTKSSCDSRVCMRCPSPTVGFPRTSPRFPNCCNNHDSYCATDWPACVPGSCCPLNYSVSCEGFCCPSSHPVCGENRMCYEMGCTCQGCSPDPCQFQKCANCETCCKAYGGVCTGPHQCHGNGRRIGFSGIPATEKC